uniref:Uncharacterized protein n=1 Tax=Opuntia streptacantha TaxID=393608 RepID=A0A7C9D5B8_OPUST
MKTPGARPKHLPKGTKIADIAFQKKKNSSQVETNVGEKAAFEYSPKFEATSWDIGLSRTKIETSLLVQIGTILNALHFLVFLGPVFLQDFDSLLIDVVVIMRLQILNLIQTLALINHLSIQVHSIVHSHCFVSLSHL